MENENKKIIEINGVKLEVDMRYAKTLDTFKVGDRVKLLKKKWSDTWESCAGVIVGFDEFKTKPTIIIAYIQDKKLEFAYLNSESKDLEICAANLMDIGFTKDQVLTAMNNEIESKKREASAIEIQRDAFIKLFGKFFEKTESSNVA